MIYAEKKNILNDVVENAVDDYEDDYRTLQFKLICLPYHSFCVWHEYNKQLFSLEVESASCMLSLQACITKLFYIF